jgi:hypothetical protein
MPGFYFFSAPVNRGAEKKTEAPIDTVRQVGMM